MENVKLIVEIILQLLRLAAIASYNAGVLTGKAYYGFVRPVLVPFFGTVLVALGDLARFVAGKLLQVAVAKVGDRADSVTVTATVVAAPSSIAEVDPAELAVDPQRFQYKILGEHTKTGEVGSLSGVQKYDPNLAGILLVWNDLQDGHSYVVNGHNRLALAKRLGAEKVAVRYLTASDSVEARAIGALANIAEGQGTAVDAAKFFRDTKMSAEDVKAKGIPLRQAVAVNGMALAQLPEHLFRQVIDGDLSVERAALIGGSGLSEVKQNELYQMVSSRDKGARRLSNEAVAELVESVRAAEERVELTFDLFGASEEIKSCALERAQLLARIKSRLSREKKLFSLVARQRNAEELAKAGNSIDTEGSADVAQQAEFILSLFDKLKNAVGPVADCINSAATEMAAAKSATAREAVEKAAYKEVCRLLPEVAGFKKATVPVKAAAAPVIAPAETVASLVTEESLRAQYASFAEAKAAAGLKARSWADLAKKLQEAQV